MTDKVIENNQVVIMGEIVSDFSFSHEIFGEGFYMVEVKVERLSDSSDIIPLMVSERLIDVKADYRGQLIMVTGQFRCSVPTTAMRKERTGWFFLYLPEKLNLLMRLKKVQRPIRSIWMAISARSLFTGRRRLGGRSQIFCLR